MQETRRNLPTSVLSADSAVRIFGLSYTVFQMPFQQMCELGIYIIQVTHTHTHRGLAYVVHVTASQWLSRHSGLNYRIIVNNTLQRAKKKVVVA